TTCWSPRPCGWSCAPHERGGSCPLVQTVRSRRTSPRMSCRAPAASSRSGEGKHRPRGCNRDGSRGSRKGGRKLRRRIEETAMSRIVVLYATTDGQTGRIARHVAAALCAEGVEAQLVDAAAPPPGFSLVGADAAVVAGPVPVGRNPPPPTPPGRSPPAGA